VLRRGQAIAESILAWDNLLHQNGLLAKCLLEQGRIDEARDVVTQAERVIRQHKMKLPFDRIEAVTAGAMVRVAQAEHAQGAERAAALAEARRACRTAMHCARQLPLWLPQAWRTQGTLHWLEGDEAAARNCWRESLAAAERSSFPVERGLTLLEKGSRLGDRALAEPAAALFRQTRARTHLERVVALLGPTASTAELA
jgi:hypothetical protein